MRFTTGNHGIEGHTLLESLAEALFKHVVEWRINLGVTQLNQYVPGVNLGEGIAAAGHMTQDEFQALPRHQLETAQAVTA
ncbi:hypothetical protein D3C86_2121880 [compost metagenome]